MIPRAASSGRELGMGSKAQRHQLGAQPASDEDGAPIGCEPAQPVECSRVRENLDAPPADGVPVLLEACESLRSIPPLPRTNRRKCWPYPGPLGTGCARTTRWLATAICSWPQRASTLSKSRRSRRWSASHAGRRVPARRRGRGRTKPLGPSRCAPALAHGPLRAEATGTPSP
jgi:hypothetical protein